MQKYYFKMALAIVVISLFCRPVNAQEMLDSNFAVYEGDSSLFMMQPPADWLLIFEEAQMDGYSAAFVPPEQEYSTSEIAINIWIFKNDSLAFENFIKNDTVNYLGDGDNKIEAVDTILLDNRPDIVIFDFHDPGGSSSLAKVAYLNARSETVIYELHIASREFYIKAISAFEDALNNFSISKSE